MYGMNAAGICFEEEDLLTLLTGLVDELERRKTLFRNAECPDIVEYNKTTRQALKRYIFACDEVAEVLDKTGRSKEQKELLSQIESKLSIIARQGRAFGIHLILATQRPDANLIPGQLRTNLGCRICGRADGVITLKSFLTILRQRNRFLKMPEGASFFMMVRSFSHIGLTSTASEWG